MRQQDPPTDLPTAGCSDAHGRRGAGRRPGPDRLRGHPRGRHRPAPAADDGAQQPRRRLRPDRPDRGQGHRDDGITDRVEVFNVIGAGGTVAMARLMNEEGNGDLIMMMGLGVVGATFTNKTDSRVSMATPIAKLIEEPRASWCRRTRRSRRSASSSRPGRPIPAQGHRRRRFLPRRARPPVPDGDSRWPSGVDPDLGQLHLLRRRRRAADRAARQQDRLRHLGSRRVHRPDRGRPGAGARGVRRRSASPASTPRR